jgi:proline iminopeptidase
MYPKIKPYVTKHLHVDTLFSGENVTVYIECSGNPKGYPVVYLHGGPGDRINPHVRRLYNPKKYNIIMFDQRGCGNSKPSYHTEKNTTQHLISDMEKIREWIGCEKWLVTGGSWGSSLALLYAQAHPSRTTGLIIRGIYDLSTDTCVMDTLFADNKEKMDTLLKLKTDKDSERYRKTNRVLKLPKKNKTRKQLLNLLSEDNGTHAIFSIPAKESAHEKETIAVIGNHYEQHHYFVPKNIIYKNMYKIKHLPCYIVNGRYDIVTPFNMAYKLKKMFTTCYFEIVKGGHTVMEPEITKALVKASDDFIR